jgi:uncharacterized membrane protein YkvA (DUF1232 family)
MDNSRDLVLEMKNSMQLLTVLGWTDDAAISPFTVSDITTRTTMPLASNADH